METSPLPTVARDAVYALCRRMVKGSTVVPPQHTLSLNELSSATGWSKRHLQRALDYLEMRDIVVRNRPSKHKARTEHARTTYGINYEALLRLGTGSPKKARDTRALGLGPPRRKPRAKATDELGTGSPGAGDTMAHDSDLSVHTDQTDPELAFIRVHIGDRTGRTVTQEMAERIRARILARPGSTGQPPLTYLRRVLALDKHPERWLEEPPETTTEEP